MVARDLRVGEGLDRIGRGLPGAVPLDEPLEGGFEVEARGPVEVGAGAAGVEFEVAGFVEAWVGSSRTQEAPSPQKLVMWSAIQATGWASSSAGPKL